MIAISFKFLAGRYHATPWGRHVNEGAVEWPPSPWRILRALVATWKRTLPDLPQDKVEPILRALAAPPEFKLPAASTGHTRHYMPWQKGWKPEEPEKARTLVFDTFVAVPRDAVLLARWPDASLDDAQRETLARILANLNTLGRSESWCEVTLLNADDVARTSEHQLRVCAPLNGIGARGDAVIFRMLCPDANCAFADEHIVTITTKTTRRGKNKQTIEARSTIYNPAWNLCMETLQLHKERWSDPPGSRWVQYARPRDCFKVQPIRAEGFSSHERTTARIQVARFALDSTVLPLVTETLTVAEAARRALMSIHGRLTEENGARGRSAVFSGKDRDGDRITGHGHAYYLPTDEDGDGRLDHLTVVARDGFDSGSATPEEPLPYGRGSDHYPERRALDRLRNIRPRGRDNASHPLRVLLLGMGILDEYHPGPLAQSKVWVSATPYIATRYAKTRGRDRIDIRSPQACAAFLITNLRGQLRAVLADSVANADEVKITPDVDDHGVFRIRSYGARHDLRPIQFKRYRSKSGDDGGRRLAGVFHLEFPTAVRGPVVLGHGAHFGLGLFLPCGQEGGTAPH